MTTFPYKGRATPLSTRLERYAAGRAEREGPHCHEIDGAVAGLHIAHVAADAAPKPGSLVLPPSATAAGRSNA
jgi:hypothetical protein